MTKKTKGTNSSVKISDLKDGDIVLIKMVYVDNIYTRGNPEFRLSGDDPDFLLFDNVSDSDIHSILESPIRVGDIVRFKNENTPLVVKAIVDERAWVQYNESPRLHFVVLTNGLAKVSQSV